MRRGVCVYRGMCVGLLFCIVIGGIGIIVLFLKGFFESIILGVKGYKVYRTWEKRLEGILKYF